MELDCITGEFVRVAGIEDGSRGLLGILTGFVPTQGSIKARVFCITTHKTSVVSFESCRLVSPHGILHGLRGLVAFHPQFDQGVVVAEKRPSDLLMVQLRKIHGSEVSDFLPLTEVTFAGSAVKLT